MIKIDFKAVCRFRNCTLFLFVLVGATVFGQITQTVSGTVSDAISKPLMGANVQLVGSDSIFLAVSGSDGKFSISVRPGRYWVKTTFTGFSNYEEELLVIAGKASAMKIVLQESSQQLGDVEVTSGVSQELPGSYSISIEKTMRVPANFFDPVRMATSLPGVVGTNDQSNSISIKGYSPNAMLWRLQGLDIVNPNHLANAGTLSDKPVANGGGVSILSAQVLDKTNFYSGTLPVQYGNALSGAMDMSMRPGSKTNREHTIQASLIGIDLATEGPMRKKSESGESNASYLVNYRYSTVGLLSQMGVNFGDEAINFQDLTFNLDFNHKRGGNLSVFGFGGLSSNKFDRKPEAEWEFEKDRYNIDFTGKVFGVGFSNTNSIGSTGVLKTGLAFSGQNQERRAISEPVPIPHIEREYFLGNRFLVSALADYKEKYSERLTWNLGVMISSNWHKGRNATISTTTPPNVWIPEYFMTIGYFQTYFDTKWQIKNSWQISAGVRLSSLSTTENVFEPRLSATRNFPNGNLNLSYGVVSQMNQFRNYVDNIGLRLNKAHQALLGYSHRFNNGIQLNTSAYFHYLWNIPTGFALGDTVTYSVLNQFDDFSIDNLTSVGKGINYGLDVTLERKFSDKSYFLVAASWYQSQYKGRSLPFEPTRFSGNFTSSLNGGKEWGKRNKAFGLHARLLYLGGLRQPSIDVGQSQTYGTTIFSNPTDFSQQLPNYFRMDLRASWRKNKPGYTRTISIDIQNLTGQQNLAYRYFDTFTQKVEKKNQLGLIPVLVYRIDF